MCVIVVKKAGIAVPSMDILNQCWEKNSDGAGFYFLDRTENIIRARKGFMTFKAFKRAFKQQEFTAEDTLVIHFRISTSGGVCPANTHPFPVSVKEEELKYTAYSTDLIVAHNGVFGAGKDDLSDTMLFIQQSLWPIRKLLKNRVEGVIELLNRALGTANRLALFGKGFEEPLLLGGTWTEDKDTGLFFSNTNWKPYTYQSYGYGYYANADGYWQWDAELKRQVWKKTDNTLPEKKTVKKIKAEETTSKIERTYDANGGYWEKRDNGSSTYHLPPKNNSKEAKTESETEGDTHSITKTGNISGLSNSTAGSKDSTTDKRSTRKNPIEYLSDTKEGFKALYHALEQRAIGSKELICQLQFKYYDPKHFLRRNNKLKARLKNNRDLYETLALEMLCSGGRLRKFKAMPPLNNWFKQIYREFYVNIDYYGRDLVLGEANYKCCDCNTTGYVSPIGLCDWHCGKCGASSFSTDKDIEQLLIH